MNRARQLRQAGYPGFALVNRRKKLIKYNRTVSNQKQVDALSAGLLEHQSCSDSFVYRSA